MPAPSLTPEQKKVLRILLAEGRNIRDPRVRRIYERAATQTGLVESGLRELDYGDADSKNWRQEREQGYGAQWAKTGGALNTAASARRFREEFEQHYDPGEKSYEVAAQVQRPREDLRGRYREEAAAAAALIKQLGGGSGGKTTAPGTTTTTRVGGIDNQAARGALVASFLQGGDSRFTQGTSAAGLESRDPVQFALAIRGLKDTPGQVVKTTTPAKSSAGGKTPRPEGPLLELFWQGEGGINVKNGKRVPQGFVSGHQTHVHVGADPSTAVRLGLIARRMGLKVGENEYFTGTAPTSGHTATSNHYVRGRTKLGKRAGGGIDVTGDPAKLREYAHTVAELYGL